MHGAPRADAAQSTHSLVRTLCDGGATLVGAARIDGIRAPGLRQCSSTELTGNPAYPGRAILGGIGALAALVAAQKADIGFTVDGSGEALMAAACVGTLALRGSHGTLDADEISQRGGALLPSISCAAPTFILRSGALMSKVRRLHASLRRGPPVRCRPKDTQFSCSAQAPQNPTSVYVAVRTVVSASAQFQMAHAAIQPRSAQSVYMHVCRWRRFSAYQARKRWRNCAC